MTNPSVKTLGLRKSAKTSIKIPVDSFRSQPLASIHGAKLGNCFVRVTDIPLELEDFMRVNPRNPSRDDKDALRGTVVKGIMDTLFENPADMAIKNQGIYLLVEEVKTYKEAGAQEVIEITLSDQNVHGIVNGGHTYAAIMDANDTKDVTKLESLEQAFVRLHIMSGVEKEKVVEIAEGLNRSKQVDDPSLAELSGQFEQIKKVMSGKTGEEEISYHQGDSGDFYITHVLSLMEMFNLDRFPESKYPTSLYNSQQYGLKYFLEDSKKTPLVVDMLTSNLPDILELHDEIKKVTPDAAKRNGFTYSSMKIGSARAGSAKNKGVRLHFIGEDADYRVPNGWAYPIISSFRANVNWDSERGVFEWKVPIAKLLPTVIDELVRICVNSNKEVGAPDKVGKQSSVYDSCYMKVERAVNRWK